MSSTSSERVESLVKWLHENAYWREDLRIESSTFGGLGVFLPNELEMAEDPLLLRIPKSNLLSPKNASIYNLLVDYEPENDEVDLAGDMYGVIISVIYEVALGSKSPWYAYLQSIDIAGSSVPVCLWSEDDKQNLKNSEIDMKDLLSDAELIDFYIEACSFASAQKLVVPIPEVLELDKIAFGTDLDRQEVVDTIKNQYGDKLTAFGRYISAVISRAFTIDDFHGLALVPAADLFNHIQPSMVEGKIQGNENIHFVCDGNVCDICGDLESNVNEEEDEGDDDDDEEEEEDEENSDEEDDKEEKIEEITLDYIKKMEEEMKKENESEEDSDTETMQDPEEVSTLTLSEDDDHPELAAELAESSKCCDVLLVRPPEKQYSYEVFNSYGNELSNPYLLQKYGFIVDDNVNDYCLLSVQMFRYIKDIKSKMSKDKAKQFDEKLDWYDKYGFEIVNGLILEENRKNKSHDHEHEHDHDHRCCDDDGCEDGCCGEEEEDIPESWQLSVRVYYNGDIPKQVYPLLNLLDLSYNDFKRNFKSAKTERKREKVVSEFLMAREEKTTESYNKLIKSWAKDRLARYPELVASPHRELIESLVIQEKKILAKFIDKH
ncbi:hypothetical protein PICST_52332 [Scheffersomyces stipitis CBS 6054]|uniref:Ribosomal lysine N-methyltransferase 3 n=1 Tax=Scheffersomyces stipitis (strain ATCC 58785 / CBS 6054 / NBRC 10063 / NRRL Y-11545) TaxID=322104 RepID=A3GGT5_PICST|nr:predicted protein [Scheffersomyces stipitis CBS 6054]EAZ63977.2 hypothetical protein PICST_52332 [Scheffersomyces stipitis CBS 6054]